MMIRILAPVLLCGGCLGLLSGGGVSRDSRPRAPEPQAIKVQFPATHFYVANRHGNNKDTLFLTVHASGANNVAVRLVGQGTKMTQGLVRDFCLGVGSNVYLSASPCSFPLTDLKAGRYDVQLLVDDKVAATRPLYLKDTFFFELGTGGKDFNADEARKGSHTLILDPAQHGDKLTIDPDKEDATLFLTMNAAEFAARVALIWLKGDAAVAVIEPDESYLQRPHLDHGGPVERVVPLVFRKIPALTPDMRAVVLVDRYEDGRTHKTARAVFEVTSEVVKALAGNDYATMARSPLDERSPPAQRALAADWRHSSGGEVLWENTGTMCAVVKDEEARMVVAKYLFHYKESGASANLAAAQEQQAKNTYSAGERARLKSGARASAGWADRDNRDAEKLVKQIQSMRERFKGDCL